MHDLLAVAASVLVMVAATVVGLAAGRTARIHHDRQDTP